MSMVIRRHMRGLTSDGRCLTTSAALSVRESLHAASDLQGAHLKPALEFDCAFHLIFHAKWRRLHGCRVVPEKARGKH